MRWLLLLLALAALPARAEDFPRQLVDGLGRTVTIPREPQRIVAIFASNVEILVAIGATERIVGIEAWTRWPPELLERPKIGGRLGFSVEAIARLEPDLVIMTPARQAATLLEPLRRIGIPAIVLTHRDLPSILANIALLGRATGLEAEAAALVGHMEARLAAVQARLAGHPPLSVYLEVGSNDRGTFLTAREGTYTLDILHLAGGESIFAGEERLTQIGGEAIYSRDPDVIVVAGDAATVGERPGWSSIPAVAEGRIVPVPRALLLIPGPRVVEGVERLARLLHPEAFAP